MNLNSIASVLKMVDHFAPQQEAFLAGQPAPKDEVLHGVMATQQNEEIVFTDRQDRRVTKLKVAHLKKLDPRSQQLIRAYERAMEDLFDRWTDLEPKCFHRDQSVRATVRAEAEQVRRDMCPELGEILRFIDRVHGPLSDHYQHVRHVCERPAPTS